MCWRLPDHVFTLSSQKAYYYFHIIDEELRHREINLSKLVKGRTRLKLRDLWLQSPLTPASSAACPRGYLTRTQGWESISA